MKTQQKQNNSEPKFTKETSDKINLIRGLNYYSENYTFSESKAWALSWVKKNCPELYSSLKGLSDQTFSNRGFVCRMNENGFILDEKTRESLIEYFKRLSLTKLEVKEQNLERTDNDKKKKKEVFKVNQSMMNLQDVIDDVLENKKPRNFSLTNDANEILAVIEYCKKTLEDMKNFKEYFSLNTISSLKPVLLKCLKQAEDSFSAIKSSKTKVQVRPKKVNPISMVKSVKYKKKDEELGIESESILSVVGAQKAFVYDTRTRELRLYISNSDEGFMFTGTTLKNYDPEKSVCKKVRKPMKFFEKLKDNRTIRSLNAAFKELNAKERPIISGGRFNENLIIVKSS